MSIARRAALGAVALFAVGAAGVTTAAGHPAGDVVGSVIEIPDGDTVIVEISGRRRAVDLLGVRAPSPSSCQGKRARAALRWMLPRLIRVRVGAAGAIPESGRFAAEIRLPGAVGVATVNRAMLASGNGRARLGRPRSRFQAAYLSAERSARGHDRGLWSARCAADDGSGEDGDEQRPPDGSPGGGGQGSGPGGTAPAPIPLPPPPPPPPAPPGESPEARIERLLTNVALVNRTADDDGEGSITVTDTRFDFCSARTFKYLEQEFVDGDPASETMSAGIWIVRQDPGGGLTIEFTKSSGVALGPAKIVVNESGGGLQVTLYEKAYTAGAATC